MKTILLACLLGFFGLQSNAQVKKASLQASGLTCSMCSKAVLTALQDVSFVEKVQVDIKNQTYHLSFKQNEVTDLDALAKAVEDAGFSVAGLKVTADAGNVKVEKDQHLQIGNQYFHFLNGKDQQLKGETTFTIVDKAFTSSKNYKKYSALSKKECVRTGKMAKCCSADENMVETRVYHAII
ncbi:MAG: heavy-metal-associated domain-containing protein [Flavisolibacter sp.]